MTKITQIEDKGATVAWSPLTQLPDVVALGAKVSGCDVVYSRCFDGLFVSCLSFSWDASS